MDPKKLEAARAEAVANCEAGQGKAGGPVIDPALSKVLAAVVEGINKFGVPFLLQFLSGLTP